MKRYLRIYINHQQDDEADWLSMIEYVLNAFVLITTQVFSFLANYDFESRMNFNFNFSFDENTIRKRVQRFRNKKIVFIMKKIWTFAKEHMKKINKISSRMQIDIELSRFIIKLKIKYDYLLKTFKRIDHQENSITKCSNRSRFWKKEDVFTSLICQTKWIFIRYFIFHYYERISKTFCQNNSFSHHHQSW
jgi:hypothetical protein